MNSDIYLDKLGHVWEKSKPSWYTCKKCGARAIWLQRFHKMGIYNASDWVTCDDIVISDVMEQ